MAGRRGHAGTASWLAGSSTAAAGGRRPARRRVALRGGDLQPRPRRGFPEVEQVLQLGSPKGVARLRQRAGRARHRPGAKGAIVCIPSHALELAEYAAVRRALHEGVVEARRPPTLSLDVLAQHAVSRALAGGLTVMRCWRRCVAPMPSPRWAMNNGGPCWTSSCRVGRRWRSTPIPQGRARCRWQLPHARSPPGAAAPPVDRHHQQRWQRARAVPARWRAWCSGGAVRQPPASRRPFQFAGRLLELVQLRDMTASCGWHEGAVMVWCRAGREASCRCRCHSAVSWSGCCPAPTTVPNPAGCHRCWHCSNSCRRFPGQSTCWWKRCGAAKASSCSSTPCRPPRTRGTGRAVGAALHPPATQQHWLCGERSWPGAGAGAADRSG